MRIKVADDNDLKTARAGLLMCAEFFEGVARLKELEHEAARDEYALLQDLRDLMA